MSNKEDADFASLTRRSRQCDESARHRERELARMLRAVAHLEVNARIIKAERLLRIAEAAVAGEGIPRENWLQRLFRRRRGVSTEGGKDLVDKRKAQLERLRSDEGPKHIDRAETLAKLLCERPQPVSEDVPPRHVAETVEAASDATRPEVETEKASVASEAKAKPVLNGTNPLSSGRPVRSPIG